MPEMASSARGLCTSRPYRLIARNVLLPWALQGVRPAGEVLEIGAGSGAMAAGLLRRFPDVRILATDIDAEMVAFARRTLGRWSGRATVEQADATSLRYEDGRFDLVLSCAMLHHVVDWERALSELARVLAPGGRLVGFDLAHTASLHGDHSPSHGHESGPGESEEHDEPHRAGARRMVDPGAFEHELAALPFGQIRVRRSLGRVAFRFVATRAARAHR